MEQDETTAVLSKSFGSVADDYNRLRSGPPSEAFDFLLPEGAADVLEIGAGTGILTRLLVERIPHVTAIEPDDRMRALSAASAPDLEAIAGPRRGDPGPLSSYDVVIAQSAWHWVDEARAVPEVARLLRPHGRLSLAWTGTDRSVDWMRSLWAGGVELDPDEKNEVDRGRRSRHMVNVEAGGPSPFEEPETRLFRWTRPMSKSDLVALGRHLQPRHRHGRQRPPGTSRLHDALPRHARSVLRSRHHRRPHALVLLAGDETLRRSANTALSVPRIRPPAPVKRHTSARELHPHAHGTLRASQG